MRIRHTTALLAAAIVQVLWCLPSAAAGPVEESQIHIREAALANRDNDLDGFISSLETAYALNPASLSTRYNLACGYAQSGRTDAALDMLASLANDRIDFGIAADADLESLRGLDRFQALVTDLERRTQPILSSEPFTTFEQYGLAPEGIALDPASGRFFFGSMRTGEVYAVGPDKRISRFANVDSGNRLSAVGMTVDSESGLLWVVGAGFELAENAGSREPARSGLFGFDLETGELRKSYRVAEDGEMLNDVALGPDGSLYATGSSVFIADDARNLLRPVETTVEVFGSNGITVTPDGEALIVTSYPVGLFAIDADTGETRKLTEPDGVTLYGIDGLYWHEGALIGVQNGARPWRLLRMHVNAALTAVTSVDVLEMGNDATTPMTGAIDGDVVYYIGETAAAGDRPSQFPAVMRGNLGAVTIRKARLGGG